MRSEHVGTILRECRSYRRLTQKELAEKVGMSEAVIRGIEHGTRPVSEDELIAVCVTLDVSTEAVIVEGLKRYAQVLRPKEIEAYQARGLEVPESTAARLRRERERSVDNLAAELKKLLDSYSPDAGFPRLPYLTDAVASEDRSPLPKRVRKPRKARSAPKSRA
jgi:transcriptional regulator with XRE-family HTH domain